jgi:hypothetical protein
MFKSRDILFRGHIYNVFDQILFKFKFLPNFAMKSLGLWIRMRIRIQQNTCI